MKVICVLCGKHYKGFGNNAEPLARQRCCDKCKERIDRIVKEVLK